jgi:hypothetical protein
MRRTVQVKARAVLLSAVPTRSYWTTVRAPGASAGRAVGAGWRRQREQAAGLFAAGGQRRFLADEKKEEKKQEKVMGVFAAFMKSVREQMSAKAESDEDLAAAQERLEQARQESLANAEKAMQKAKEAAEEAKTDPPPATCVQGHRERASTRPSALAHAAREPPGPHKRALFFDVLTPRLCRRGSAQRCWKSRRVPRVRWWAARWRPPPEWWARLRAWSLSSLW